MRRILVVCTANQCRSPMAEGLIRDRLARDGLQLQIEASSAGTWASPGSMPTDLAVTVMAERGIDISELRSSEVDEMALTRSDMVLVMTAGHQEALVTEWPHVAAKTRLISSLAGGSWDVADPIGKGLDEYRATAHELARLIDAGWDLIVDAGGRSLD